MKTIRMNQAQRIPAMVLTTLSALLTGCGVGGTNSTAATTPVAAHPKLQGSAFGGQQPIAGAAIGLYIASIKAYQDPIQNILKAAVLTDTNGNFSITGDYTCQSGDQLYIISMGGNPGAGTNPNAALMAALGDCSNLNSQTFISMNEVTTVGSVFALAPFMASATALGTSGSTPASSGNVAGLVHAFASVHKLVNVASGTAPGDMLPAGAVAPTGTINMMANILAGCINSAGDTGPGSYCHNLFAEVTPANGTLPTDTIGAALLMAKNPTLNVANIYSAIPPSSPFSGMPSKAPNDWTLAITYKTGGFNNPSSTTVDQAGNIWVANTGNNTITMLTQAGVPTTLSGNGLTAPTAIAIDINGNAWIANSTASSLSAFNIAGAPLNGSPFMPTGIDLPVSLAFDATGNLWVANSGNSSVVELSASGAALQQIAVQGTPSAIAIDPK